MISIYAIHNEEISLRHSTRYSKFKSFFDKGFLHDVQELCKKCKQKSIWKIAHDFRWHENWNLEKLLMQKRQTNINQKKNNGILTEIVYTKKNCPPALRFIFFGMYIKNTSKKA